MTGYLFLLIIIAYAISYWIISGIRLGKLRRLQAESGYKETFVQSFQKNKNTIGILLLLFVLLAVCCILLPQCQTYFGVLKNLQLKPIKYTGFFLIKLSFIWLIASQFQISRIIDEEVALVPKRIQKIIRAEVIGVCLLSLGIFLSLPSCVGLLLCIGPLLLLKPVK